MESNPKL